MSQQGCSKDQPFPGLRPFEYEDRDFYFGRTEQIYALYSLVYFGFIAVIGSSGSGKSSLVRAGLRPLLEHESENQDGGRTWRVATMTPGNAPIANLAAAVASLGGQSEDVARIEYLLRRSSAGLAEALDEIESLNAASVLLIVDQFEELFRVAGARANRDPVSEAPWRNEASAFVQLLLQANRRRDSAHVLITMRSDFIGDCAQFQGLPEAVSGTQFLTPALSRSQREEAIRRPLEEAGATIDAALVESLLGDVGEEVAQLPVLSHALARLWTRAWTRAKERGGKPQLGVADYVAIGGVKGALSKHANEIMADLAGLEGVVEQVFRALSERDKEGRATRRPVEFKRLVEETGASEGDVRRVVDRFRADDCSFLSPPTSTVKRLKDDTRIDVVHEALLHRWDRISEPIVAGKPGWLYAEEEDGRTYRALLAMVDTGTTVLPLNEVPLRQSWWESRSRTPAWAERYGGGFERVTKLFKDSAAAHGAAGRTRAVAIAMGAIAVIALVLGGISFSSQHRLAAALAQATFAEKQARVAEQRAKVAMGRERGAEARLRILQNRRARALIVALRSAEVQGDRAKVAADLASRERNNALVAASLASSERQKAEAAAALASQERTKAIASAKLASRARNDALVSESRFLARFARNAVDQGDAELGKRLALEALPKGIAHPNRPFVSAAEYALENAVANQRERLVLRGHGGAVDSAAYSPDGSRVVSASDDKTVRIWDAASGAEIAVLRGHQQIVESAAFSRDGRRIVSASDDKTVRIWDAVSGAQLLVLRGHTDEVWHAAFSPDGARVVSASRDKTVRIWDAASGAQITVLGGTVGHTDAVDSAEFSPDGSRVVSGSKDQTVRIWDAASGAQLKLLKGHEGTVISALFSPDGKRIVSASGDNTVRIWDATTGAQISELRGHEGRVTSAAYSVDGRRIVSASFDKTVRLWDATSGAQIAVLRAHDDRVSSAAFSPDGRRVVSASLDNTIRIWDSAVRAQVALFQGHEESVWSAAFSPDERRAVTAGFDKTVRIWDVATGAQLHVLRGHTGYVFSAAFSPDGRHVASASLDKTVRIWDAASGAQIAELRGAEYGFSSVAFSPDGRRIVSATWDNTVFIWDEASHVRLAVFAGHKDFVNSAAFSPDGRRVVSASDDKTVRIWDAASGRELQVLRGHTDQVWSAEFSPDGRRVVSASYDKTIRIWDVPTGRQLKVLRGHEDIADSAAFSPDGSLVVSGGDRTVRIWNAASGAQIVVLRGHDALVTSAAFSRDGRRVISASGDKTARVWQLPPRNQTLIDAARATASH